ncbi:MAG: zf-HC2 domain-containing protein [Sandaracinaceae bacterium]
MVRRHADAVVDGEVDADTQIEFEQHLATCGPCRVHMSFARSFKEQVQDACAAPAAPGDLASRIRLALDAEDTRQAASEPGAVVGAREPSERAPLGVAGMRIGGVRVLPVRARYAVPAAAAAVALAFLAAREGGNPVGEFLGADPSLEVEAASAAAGTNIFDEVVRRHNREHPPEVTGPPTQVAGWFQDKIEFPVRPIEFTRPGVRLVGGRLSNVRDREAAAFFYEVHGQRVTVMVFEHGQGVEASSRRQVSGRSLRFGYGRGRAVPVVEHRGLTYAIAGDLDERSLLQLAATARVR